MSLRPWSRLYGHFMFCRLHPTYHKNATFDTPFGLLRREVSGIVTKVATRPNGELDYILLQPQRKDSRAMRIYECELYQLELRALAGNRLVSVRAWRAASFKNQQKVQ